MAQAEHTVGEPAATTANRTLVRTLILAAAVLFLVALGLWARYGSAIFLETMANAWAYCF